MLILPYLEQGAIYDAYNFAEPWDGPNNRKLAGRIGSIFRRPEDTKESTLTRFVAVVGPETAYPGSTALNVEDLKDGAATTISFVEIDRSDIHWMEPRDLRFDRMSFRINAPGDPGIGSPYGEARVSLADGMVRSLGNDTSPRVVRALLTRDGGEAVVETKEGRFALPPAAARETRSP